MKTIRILGSLILVGVSFGARAIPIEVTATGTISSGEDLTNVFGLGVGSLIGNTVTATWTFDTDDVPPDPLADSDQAYYDAAFDWITGTVTVTAGVNEDSIPTDDGPTQIDQDYVFIQSGEHDYYEISTYTEDDTGFFFSTAFFFELFDDILQGVDAGQPFNWSDDDDEGYGLGSFAFFASNGQSDDSLAFGNYDLASMTSRPVSVPEPATLSLLGAGLLGLFMRRRRSGR